MTIQGDLFDNAPTGPCGPPKPSDAELLKAQTDAAIKRGVDHANRVHKNWLEEAIYYLTLYLKDHPGYFLCEDVRGWVEATFKNFPTPPTKRAWGGVMNSARARGLIRSEGTTKTKSLEYNASFKAYWIKK